MRICSLASGSSGNSIYVEKNETKVLIDSGLSGKAIEERLAQIKIDPKDLTGILITHEHSDHIKGVGVLSRRYDLPIYATENTWSQLSSIGKIAEYNQQYINKEKGIELGDLKIECFSTSHDAADPIGFSFYAEENKVGIATDTGYLSDSVKKSLSDCEFLFLEANYDDKMLDCGSYPFHLKRRIKGQKGHLSNRIAAESLVEMLTGKTKKVMLAHLSEENNLPSLAFHTVKDILEDIGLKINRDLELDVAPRYGVSDIVEVK